MRTCLLILFAAVTFALPAEEPLSLMEAEARIFEAYDNNQDLPAVDKLPVATKDQTPLKWLVAAATQEVPQNPFRKGSSAWREAETLRRLPTLPPDKWPAAFNSQSLSLSGSSMFFWRWGQRLAREGRMDKALRQRWEDVLLKNKPSSMLMSYALRHALCFALAEGDEARFAALKERWSESAKDLFLDFQRAFALLRSPSPTFSLWRLPEIAPDVLPLHELGGHNIWISPDSEQGLPELPAGTIWVVPTKEGLQPESQITLLEPSMGEAKALSARLSAAHRTAFLAPVRKPFETYALVYFPILIELDSSGIILHIRMGDAALAK